MLKRTKFLISGTTFLTLTILLGSCASQRPLNDFFGIRMNPADEAYFIIHGYSEHNGVYYESTSAMNPLIYAWAQLGTNDIRIKIINNSKQSIPSSYNQDNFMIVLSDGNTFVLSKGDPLDFPGDKTLFPNTSLELRLELPSDFWETIGMKDPQSYTADYMKKFWRGENKLNVIKENIQKIVVELGKKYTIVLKPVLKKH